MVSGTEGFSGECAIPRGRLKHHYLGGQMLVHLVKELICFRQYAIYLHRYRSYIDSIHTVYIYILYIFYIYNIHAYIESTHRHAREESSEIPSAKLRRRDIFGRCSGRSGEETRAANLAKCSALAPWILEHGERICR